MMKHCLSFQRLKKNEAYQDKLEWHANRILTKMNYLVHTNAIKNIIIPNLTEKQKRFAEEEAKATSKMIALSALKYGDLSNQASKDYIFDVEKFSSFEGDTGPYILYTIVRIKSILNKYVEQGGNLENLEIKPAANANEKALEMAKKAGKNCFKVSKKCTI